MPFSASPFFYRGLSGFCPLAKDKDIIPVFRRLHNRNPFLCPYTPPAKTVFYIKPGGRLRLLLPLHIIFKKALVQVTPACLADRKGIPVVNLHLVLHQPSHMVKVDDIGSVAPQFPYVIL